MSNPTKAELLAKMIPKPSGCWEWQLLRSPEGYGRKNGTVVHRIAWELWNGNIPKGMLVLHHCDNPPCFNPDHLFLGTHADNRRDAVTKRRHAIGEKHGRSILTEQKVKEIRRLRSKGASATQLSRMFGVTLQQILHVVRREHWRNVK